ncbi:hypothetical protein LZ31DRAFT_571660 [Colletotrichum somersetense]|nr:hypothetical protein LZ31DRAFT_571660 [Colletotrichum somersetense]
MAFIKNLYKQGPHKSVIISTLAVLGIQKDGRWHHLTEYTTNYSAIIKVVKMLVVYQAWSERQDEVAEISKRMQPDEAYDKAQSVFQRVRGKVQRFMTQTPRQEDDKPRSRDRLSFRQVQAQVCKLAEMFHRLAAEAQGLLAQLTAVDVGVKGGQSALAAALPAILWSGIHNDHSQDRPGYSFLQDDRNKG